MLGRGLGCVGRVRLGSGVVVDDDDGSADDAAAVDTTRRPSFERGRFPSNPVRSSSNIFNRISSREMTCGISMHLFVRACLMM